jgi:hypothetical protein
MLQENACYEAESRENQWGCGNNVLRRVLARKLGVDQGQPSLDFVHKAKLQAQKK